MGVALQNGTSPSWPTSQAASRPSSRGEHTQNNNDKRDKKGKRIRCTQYDTILSRLALIRSSGCLKKRPKTQVNECGKSGVQMYNRFNSVTAAAVASCEALQQAKTGSRQESLIAQGTDRTATGSRRWTGRIYGRISPRKVIFQTRGRNITRGQPVGREEGETEKQNTIKKKKHGEHAGMSENKRTRQS